MKTSYKWLQQYIDIPWQPDQLAEALTMAGLEVEEKELLNDLDPEVVVAHILSREPHPDADKLSVCKVDDGSGEPLQIVCGAPNCDAGKKAVLGRTGAVLPGDFKLKKSKIRGVESYGMLCAKDELGLGEDHSGIIILPDDAPVGTPFRDVLGIDTMIDWEITPNRSDWLSHVGIAREIGALTGNVLNMPTIGLKESGGDIHELAKVVVEDPDLCPRYTARVIRNVTIKPSPEWLRKRLESVGLRPINNVVDITNFVLYELGQPLHAFDYDELADHTIVVRRAEAGEVIQTLDDAEHKLTTDDLLIADGKRGVALAGVMGGANSEISDKTTTVLLESAKFFPSAVRATARRLGISTDSSYRFEREVDIEMVKVASDRACQLICDLAGGELVSGIIDSRQGPYVAPEVSVRFARINSLLGTDIPAETVEQILNSLGLLTAKRDESSLTVAVPPWRHDLEREADLIEEVARVYGLEKIPTAIPAGKLGGDTDADTMYPLQKVRSQFLALGLDECGGNIFTNVKEAIRQTGFSEAELVKVSNPISPDFGVMRPTLLCDMVATTAHNIAHGNHNLELFEIGRVFANRANVQEERVEACMVLSGLSQPGRFSAEREVEYDFYDLKGRLEDLLVARRIRDYRVAKAAHPVFRKGVCASVSVGDTTIATFGELHEGLTDDMRIRHRVYMALIDLDQLLALSGEKAIFSGLPQFPATTRDIAFLADETLENQQVLDAIGTIRVKFLESVELFDIFQDEKALGKGKKSMAYSFTFRHPERTLKDKEVNKAYDFLRQELSKALSVTMR